MFFPVKIQRPLPITIYYLHSQEEKEEEVQHAEHSVSTVKAAELCGPFLRLPTKPKSKIEIFIPFDIQPVPTHFTQRPYLLF